MKIFYNIACKIYISLSSLFDKKVGTNIDFAQWVSKNQLNISDREGNQYMPSTFELKNVLKKLKITSSDKILDVGCGKGKAMYMMSLFPFQNIDGIDLSKDLVEIANKNFEVLNKINCRAIYSNAVQFDLYDNYTMFYFYNPFPEEIFRQVMNKIKISYQKNPRKITFIYMNPVCERQLMETGIFIKSMERKSIISWFKIICYETIN